MISYLLRGIAIGLLLHGVTELLRSPASSAWCWSLRGSTGTSLPARPCSARSERLRRRCGSTSLAVLLVLTLSACTSRGSGSQAPHVVVVVEENHAFNQIIGSPRAPFLNQLAGQGVLLTAYHAIRHHSLPNYLAMISGDTHGITTSCTGCTVTGPNLADQLQTAGISWKAYMQGLPAPCSDVARSGAYAKKHDPFIYFDGIRRSPQQCNKVVPYSQLATDLAAGRLPRFAFVVPDLDHDMHDGPVSVADAWLRDLHGQLVASRNWRPDTRLVVTFDEGTGGSSRVVTIIAGPRVRPRHDDTAYSHYSLLRSIETLFRLPYLGHAADASTATIPALADSNNPDGSAKPPARAGGPRPG
jgi:phospholipase C